MVVMGATSLSSGAGLVALDIARKSLASRPSLFATVPGGGSARAPLEASSFVGGPAPTTEEGGVSRALIIGGAVLAVLGLGVVALKIRKRKK